MHTLMMILSVYFFIWLQEVTAEPPMVTVLPNGSRVYNIENMYNFDLEAYLTEYAPHLLPYEDEIEYWSIYARIDPRIMLVLMEYQSGIVNRPNWTPERREVPFGDLTLVHGFSHQLISVSTVLKYRHRGDLIPRWFATLNRPKRENPYHFLNKLDPDDLANKQKYDDLRYLFKEMFYLEFDTIFRHRTQRWWEKLLLKQDSK